MPEARLSRRDFLSTGVLAMAGTLAGVGCQTLLLPTLPGRSFVLAAEENVGRHPFSVGLLDLAAHTRTAVPIGFRGHQILERPDAPHRVVVISHRPGTMAAEVDLREMRVTRTFASEPGHHMYGHGVFSPDGSLLYTTENEYAGGNGVIVVRDGHSFEPIGRVPSHGIGPHEILPLDDGVLLVANGGVRTNPVDPFPLAVDKMRSSLCYVEADSGKLIDMDVLGPQKLSIRHMLKGPRGEILLGLRHYDLEPAEALLALRPGGGQSRLLIPPKSLRKRMHPQALSLCIHPRSGIMAATHPRGGLVTFWDVASGEFVSSVDVETARGVTRVDDHFLITRWAKSPCLIAVDALENVVELPAELAGFNASHARTWIRP